MPAKDDYLVETLCNMGLVENSDLEDARVHAEELGAGLVDTLVQQKIINSDDLTRARAMQFGMEVIDISGIQPQDELVDALPRHLARRYQVIPVSFEDGVLSLYHPYSSVSVWLHDSQERRQCPYYALFLFFSQ